MKRIIALLVAVSALPVLAQTSQPIVVVGGALKVIPAGNALQIPSMAGSGARCVQADAAGTLTVASAACATGGSGSVTSVNVSGGTTGLAATGGPVTTSGTITLGGTLNVANGGTGSTTAGGARTNLGVVIGTDVQAYSAKLGAYAGGDTPSAFTLGIVDSVDAAAWRSALGVGTGAGTVTSVDASGGTTGLSFTGGPVTGNGTLTLGGTLGVANGGTGAVTLTGYVKGAGTGALTASASVPGSDVSGNIGGNAANVTGIVALANGGTGGTDAASARTNLGLGTAATQNTGTSGANVPLLSNGNTWGNGQTFSRNGAAASVDLILTSDPGQYARTQFRSNGSTRWTIGKGADAESGSDAGSTFIITRYDDAGASLGNALAISRATGAVTLSSALPIASGGTGATTAAAARTALGAGTGNGTVTSVAALTLGTAGTDVSSSVANGSTTPVITLNIPTASAANRGALSSADWSTFNGKQAALVSGTNIKTVGGATLLGSGDVGTIGIGFGGTGSTTANGALINLGATTVGYNFLTLPNPSAVTFPRIDASNTVTPRTAAQMVSDIGAVPTDASGNTQSVANSGTVDFSNFSGKIIINDHTSGSIGEYLVGQGTVLPVGVIGTMSGTLAYVSGINGYRFTNTSGTTHTYVFVSIRTRPAA